MEHSSLIPLSRGSFDVIVGMDWLSKRKFVIVWHEKVVRIPLEGDEILLGPIYFLKSLGKRIENGAKTGIIGLNLPIASLGIAKLSWQLVGVGDEMVMDLEGSYSVTWVGEMGE
ncbi:hypothetical protein Tco_0738754 [Tanacetum coccineum]